MLGPVLLHALTHLIRIIVLENGGYLYCPHFTGEETGAQSHHKDGLPDTLAPEPSFIYL